VDCTLLATACAQALANLTVREATAGAALAACWPHAVVNLAATPCCKGGPHEPLLQAIYNMARRRHHWARQVPPSPSVSYFAMLVSASICDLPCKCTVLLPATDVKGRCTLWDPGEKQNVSRRN
jgi:hypothetical protein